ncbi:hypothetical protein Bca4012_019267 [Brassica carinata]
MRSRGDVDVRSDAGSSRSQEEETRSLKGKKHSTNGSQRSDKSQDLCDPNYGSDSPSKNTSSNPIEYTEQERAELLRRLDSIKDHLLRGGGTGNKPIETEQNQPFLRPVNVHGPNPGPSYYHHHPYLYPYHHQDPYRRPPPVPNPNYYSPVHYPNHMTGADVVDPHSYYPATPSRYGDMMPPYSPVSSHQRLTAPYSPPVNNYNNSPSFPSSMSSPGPRGGGGGGYTRWPSDLDSEMGGGAFPREYVKKAVSVSDDARRCHPLAGGAPFIACNSCFELLYLPKKKLLTQERHHKLQCGACSQVISFKIVDKKLVFTSGNEGTTEGVSVEAEDRSTTNTVVVQELKNQGDTIRSESQHSDDEERSSVSSEQQQKEVKSVRRRVKGSKASEPTAPESASLLELFEHSNVNRAALAYGMAELGYHKPDKQEFFKKQDSVKPESVVATETEVSYNGYSNTEISEDSTRCSNGREDKNRTSNANEDGGKSIEVWVNGHLIPEELVSSAEKLAGPIQAGKYWYDYRAGFWGVMGKPCLGIIPPFIEEFSHPMPDRCAAGNTEVCVNGRELHKRDLELLVGRGLPRDKNRSYILDISGRILDGDSGEELKSLGRLAPTIQKTKHGFGMRVPRSLAS